MPNYSYNYDYVTISGNDVNAIAGLGIWTILALILSVVGGILIYCLFVNNKNNPKGKFAKWLKEFLSFRIMWIESIIKIIYYFSTIFIILFSFNFLAMGGIGILVFFFVLICGPILVRLTYEAAIMFIMIWRNTKDIAENTKKK